MDAYYFCVGGALGQHASIARPVGFRTPADQVPEAIERLLRNYREDRIGNENLRSWLARHSSEELRAQLAGQTLEAVERDTPRGAVPAGME